MHRCFCKHQSKAQPCPASAKALLAAFTPRTDAPWARGFMLRPNSQLKKKATVSLNLHTYAYLKKKATASPNLHTHAYLDKKAIASLYLHTHAYLDKKATVSLNLHTHACLDKKATASLNLHTHAYLDKKATASLNLHTHACTLLQLAPPMPPLPAGALTRRRTRTSNDAHMLAQLCMRAHTHSPCTHTHKLLAHTCTHMHRQAWACPLICGVCRRLPQELRH